MYAKQDRTANYPYVSSSLSCRVYVLITQNMKRLIPYAVPRTLCTHLSPKPGTTLTQPPSDDEDGRSLTGTRRIIKMTTWKFHCVLHTHFRAILSRARRVTHLSSLVLSPSPGAHFDRQKSTDPLDKPEGRSIFLCQLSIASRYCPQSPLHHLCRRWPLCGVGGRL